MIKMNMTPTIIMDDDVISMDEVLALYMILRNDVNSEYDRKKLAITLLQIKAKGEQFDKDLRKIEEEKEVEEERQSKWKSIGNYRDSNTGRNQSQTEYEASMWGHHGDNPFADYVYEG